MQTSRLEHVNVTVSDPMATAQRLVALFDWKIRWQGPSIQGGRSVHVGNEGDYVAVYARGDEPAPAGESYGRLAALNHIGVVVDDLDAIERRVIAMGLQPHSHADYEPGRRFYFDDPDGIEFEVVSYR